MNQPKSYMKQLILTTLGTVAVILPSAAPLHAADAQSSDLTWARRADSIALLRNGAVVWQFNYGTNQPKPFFHPLALPGGPILTADRPADHPWHHALWFAWKYINDVNYWEPSPGATLSEGRTEWRDPRVETRDDFSARIVMDIRYGLAGQEPVLTEHRVIEVSPPDARGVFHLDWVMTFVAAEKDVMLNRTPLPGEPGGQPWGGYAGLSVRFANALSEVKVVTTRGPVEFTGGTYRGKASAMDYSGTLKQREAGIAILDHPENLNSPSPWYAIEDDTMRYFSPAVLCFEPHTIKAGQSLSLRYRVWVHPGRWEAAQLQQAVEQYLKARP
jgi:hypothetical protein